MPVEGVVTSISSKRRGLGALGSRVKAERVSMVEPPLPPLLLLLLCSSLARSAALNPYISVCWEDGRVERWLGGLVGC